MRAELKELHHKLRTTTVYVTHDQIEAMTLADRIVVLRDGRIEQVGTPLELYDNPANAFVGSFLGSPSMNLFEAEVSGADPARLLLPDGEAIRLPEPARQRGKISVGIRPEHFRLVSEPGRDSLSAEVVVVEPTGHMTEVVMRKAGQDFIIIFVERVSLSPGEIVHLQPMAERVHVFDYDESFHTE